MHFFSPHCKTLVGGMHVCLHLFFKTSNSFYWKTSMTITQAQRSCIESHKVPSKLNKYSLDWRAKTCIDFCCKEFFFFFPLCSLGSNWMWIIEHRWISWILMIWELTPKLIEIVERSLASGTFRCLVINSVSCITLRSLIIQLYYLKFHNFSKIGALCVLLTLCFCSLGIVNAYLRYPNEWFKE